MKRYVLMAVAFAMVSCSSEGSQAKEIYKKALPSCVAVQVKDEVWYTAGAGFVVKPNSKDPIVITAAHVVTDGDKLEEVRIQLSDNSIVEVEKILPSKESDTAILIPKTKLKKSLRLAPKDPEIGDSVFVIGNPAIFINPDVIAFRDVIGVGIVNQILPESVTSPGSVVGIDAPVTHGNSGGVVLNNRCEVIGVLTSGFGDWGHKQFNFMVPVSTIKMEIKKLVK